MEWVETTGKSVEEAKDAALDQLGVDENDAEFVVVTEPRSGLFGRVRGEARVRARVRPASPRPKRGRSRRSGQEGRSAGSRASDTGDGETRSGGGVSLVERESRGRASPGSAGGERSTTGSSSGQRRRGRGRGSGTRQGSPGSVGSTENAEGRDTVGRRSDGAGAETTEGSGRPEQAAGTKEETVGEDLTLEEQGESAREFVEGLVELLGLEAAVGKEVVDVDTVKVSVEGPGVGILVGHGGVTLSALQELARTVVQRRTGGRTERILVDVGGYREKRAAALQRFTRQVAQEVLGSSSERALEPMSASDRKVVHDTINEIDGVVTRSVGEDPRRYIVVAPADGQSTESEDG